MFMARISAKNGHKLFETAAYPTRKLAAGEAFTAYPKAKTCSTAKAVWREEATEAELAHVAAIDVEIELLRIALHSFARLRKAILWTILKRRQHALKRSYGQNSC